MKIKLISILILTAILTTICFAQEVPKDVDTTTIQKIDQEHKNTRKFVSDELTRQRQEFYKQLDDRANYYEETANNLLTTAVLKLGMVWAGIVIFVVGITQLMRLRLEKNKFEKMLKSIRQEIMNTQRAVVPQATGTPQDIANTQTQEPVPEAHGFQTTTQDFFATGEKLQTPTKKSWGERRREKKVRKEMIKLEKERQRLQKREFAVLGRIPEPPQSIAPQQSQPRQEPEVKYDFEVTY